MENSNVQFHLIDHCGSDYFRGHHLPVIQIPVFCNMTAKKVLDCILSELNECFELYELYTEEMIKQATISWRKLYDLRKNFVQITKEDKEALENECTEPAYLFFVLGVGEQKGPFFEINLPK